MLDLKSRVHFHEIEMSIFIDQKLDRAGVLIANRLRQLDRGVPHFSSKTGAHDRRRTFFDHFLVTPLNRTIALTEVHHATVAVSHDLKFDMVRIHKQLLDINLGRSEGLLRFKTRTVESGD